MKKSDFLVIGAGIVGLSVAREIKKRNPGASVTLLEKEPEAGLHASGRNSGVLHAGFYYAADSLKARFTQEGNRELTAYCRQKKIPLNTCGKLVVTQSQKELSTLNELLARGKKNGVPLEKLTAEEAKKIEPRAKTVEAALFSPTTASVDPLLVVQAMVADARAEGIEVCFGEGYLKSKKGIVTTTKNTHEAGYIINAAGLYADKIARDYGFSENYRILPFKGLYLYSDEPPGAWKTNIYPVPDLKNPFLGVHFTVNASGHMKIGPTAIPALWREQYEGMKSFKLSELLEIMGRQTALMLFSGFDFKTLAVKELAKYRRKHLVNLAGKLAKGVEHRHYTRWGRAGIRAQLLDLRTKKLEMDFIFEKDDSGLHILNAVSPGFTCALPFARYLCDQI